MQHISDDVSVAGMLPATRRLLELYCLFTGNCIVAYWQSRQWDGPMLCPMCRRQVSTLSYPTN